MKIGDKVKAVPPYKVKWRGKIGTIVGKKDNFFKVEFDEEQFKRWEGKPWLLYEQELELVKA